MRLCVSKKRSPHNNFHSRPELRRKTHWAFKQIWNNYHQHYQYSPSSSSKSESTMCFGDTDIWSSSINLLKDNWKAVGCVISLQIKFAFLEGQRWRIVSVIQIQTVYFGLVLRIRLQIDKHDFETLHRYTETHIVILFTWWGQTELALSSANCLVSRNTEDSLNMAEKLSLKWSDFEDTIRSTFGHLRDSAHFVDVTLASEDGQQQFLLCPAQPSEECYRRTDTEIRWSTCEELNLLTWMPY